MQPEQTNVNNPSGSARQLEKLQQLQQQMQAQLRHHQQQQQRSSGGGQQQQQMLGSNGTMSSLPQSLPRLPHGPGRFGNQLWGDLSQQQTSGGAQELSQRSSVSMGAPGPGGLSNNPSFSIMNQQSLHGNHHGGAQIGSTNSVNQQAHAALYWNALQASTSKGISSTNNPATSGGNMGGRGVNNGVLGSIGGMNMGVGAGAHVGMVNSSMHAMLQHQGGTGGGAEKQLGQQQISSAQQMQQMQARISQHHVGGNGGGSGTNSGQQHMHQQALSNAMIAAATAGGGVANSGNTGGYSNSSMAMGGNVGMMPQQTAQQSHMTQMNDIPAPSSFFGAVGQQAGDQHARPHSGSSSSGAQLLLQQQNLIAQLQRQIQKQQVQQQREGTFTGGTTNSGGEVPSTQTGLDQRLSSGSASGGVLHGQQGPKIQMQYCVPNAPGISQQMPSSLLHNHGPTQGARGLLQRDQTTTSIGNIGLQPRGKPEEQESLSSGKEQFSTGGIHKQKKEQNLQNSTGVVELPRYPSNAGVAAGICTPYSTNGPYSTSSAGMPNSHSTTENSPKQQHGMGGGTLSGRMNLRILQQGQEQKLLTDNPQAANQSLGDEMGIRPVVGNSSRAGLNGDAADSARLNCVPSQQIDPGMVGKDAAGIQQQQLLMGQTAKQESDPTGKLAPHHHSPSQIQQSFHERQYTQFCMMQLERRRRASGVGSPFVKEVDDKNSIGEQSQSLDDKRKAEQDKGRTTKGKSSAKGRRNVSSEAKGKKTGESEATKRLERGSDKSQRQIRTGESEQLVVQASGAPGQNLVLGTGLLKDQQSFLDGTFAGGWQTNADLPDRRRVIFSIVKVIERMRPDANKMSQKLPLMAKKLEEHLYRSAPTKEYYMDPSTLKRRLQMIAQGLGVHRSSSSRGIKKSDGSSGVGQDEKTASCFGQEMDGDTPKGKDRELKHDQPLGVTEEAVLSHKHSSSDSDGKSTERMSAEAKRQLSFLKQNQQQMEKAKIDLPVLFQQSADVQKRGAAGTEGFIQQLQQQMGNGNQLGNRFLDNISLSSSRQEPGPDLGQLQRNLMKQNVGNAMLNNINKLLMQRHSQQDDISSQHSQQMGGPQSTPSRLLNTSLSMLSGESSLHQMLKQQSTLGCEAPSHPAIEELQKNVRQAHAQMTQMQQHEIAFGPQSVDKDGGISANSVSEDVNLDAAAKAQKKKVIRQQQQRLLLLRHASKCNAGSSCKTKFCSQMVALWKHMKKCRDKNCKTAHCLSSRCVLNHYRMCKAENRTGTCEVCAPVMKQIRMQNTQAVSEQAVDQMEHETEDHPSCQFTKDVNATHFATGGFVDIGQDKAVTEKSASSGNESTNINTMNMVSGQQQLLSSALSCNSFSASEQARIQARLFQGHSEGTKQQSENDLNVRKPEQTLMNQQQQQKHLHELQEAQQRLQQQQCLLQQLQHQQAQLLEQQKQLQQQQQHVPAQTQQGQQLQQQQALLQQLQQQFQQQQHLLQQELQRQSLALCHGHKDRIKLIEKPRGPTPSSQPLEVPLEPAQTLSVDSSSPQLVLGGAQTPPVVSLLPQISSGSALATSSGGESDVAGTNKPNRKAQQARRGSKKQQSEHPTSTPRGATRGRGSRGKGGKGKRLSKIMGFAREKDKSDSDTSEHTNEKQEASQPDSQGSSTRLSPPVPAVSLSQAVPSDCVSEAASSKRPLDKISSESSIEEDGKRSKAPSPKEAKRDPVLTSAAAANVHKKKSNDESGPEESSADLSSLGEDTKQEKVLQQGNVEHITSLIASMSVESIEQHLESLHDSLHITPRRIAQKCLPLVRKLINHPYGWVFRDAVNPVELGLPDYFDIIENPMDLGLVEKRLENGIYKDMDSFERETKLVFENAILYNGEKSDVGDMAKSLMNQFVKEYKAVVKGMKAEQQAQKRKGDACALCGSQRRLFEPTVLYCNGACGMQRIRRSATYYTDHSKSNHWCAPCFTLLRESDPILLDDGKEIRKKDLQKLKNDALPEEAWVQCDECLGWVHQICALFNGRKNKTAATYTCPKCHIEKAGRGESDTWSQTMKGAKDLPHCKMSEAIENGLQMKLEKAYRETARKRGVSVDELEKAEGLSIRVVANMDKKHLVRDEMYARYSKKGCPSEYPCRTKCILLFQTIHGVDVLLFGMYVYEYGHSCPSPNRRRVYISYLDSVQYFEPRCYRTLTYHAILIEYLRYVKERGFHTAHIWSCPPSKGDDYIFFCHPQQQLIPRDDMLCAWYHNMLDKAKADGVVLETRTFYDEYFKNDGLDAAAGPANDPTCLPYFEGDYIPGEIENIIKELNSEEEAKRREREAIAVSHKGIAGSTHKKVGKKIGTRSNPGELLNQGRDKVMIRLGQAMSNMKQNFIVVHLRSRGFAAAVELGEDVSDWIEDDEELRRNTKLRISGKDPSILFPGASAEGMTPSQQRECVSAKRCSIVEAGVEGTKDVATENASDPDSCSESCTPDLGLEKNGDTKSTTVPRRTEKSKDETNSTNSTDLDAAELNESTRKVSGVSTVEEHLFIRTRSKARSESDSKTKQPSGRSEEPIDKLEMPGSSSNTNFGDLKSTLTRHFASLKKRPRQLQPIGSTTDEDTPQESELFDSRQQFLNYCQANHFQFDELRRAKHTTMMVLFQLHNPSAPKFLQHCGSCYREITHGIRYHCNDCSNFDLCHDCYEPVVTGLWAQRDSRFAHDKDHRFTPIDMEAPPDTQKSHEERARSIKVHLDLLAHSSTCTGAPGCPVDNCPKMKKLFEHIETCSVTYRKGCKACARLLSLLSIHARGCAVRGSCPIPFCDRIRERDRRLRQQQQHMDDRRRQAQNELYRSGVRGRTDRNS